MTNMATVDAKQGVNEGGLRKGKGSVRENKLIKMATNDAKPLVNDGGSRKGRGGGGTQTAWQKWLRMMPHLGE